MRNLDKNKSKKKSSEHVKQIDALSTDWELSNNAASDWALDRVGELVTDITSTTKNRIGREVAKFVQNKETIGQLQGRLTNTFGAERAHMIAVTETTRAYAAGNTAAWKESGVIEGKEWNTNRDEIVCRLCGPLDEEVVPLNDDFSDGTHRPPRHPRCRCWVSPVPIIDPNEVPTVEFIGEGEGFREVDPFIQIAERLGHDPFVGLRPPSGRAPRGLGTEYKIRRGIESKIKNQIKFRETAQQKLLQYKGQTGMRAQWRIAVAKERVLQLDKAIETMIEISIDPYNDDWNFVQELIDGIIKHVSVARKMAA